MDRIASRQNALVRRFKTAAREGGSGGIALLDGEHLLHEALSSGVPVDVVAVADSVTEDRRERLAAQVEPSGARLVSVPEHVLAAMTPVRQPSGVVALARCGSATVDRTLTGTRQLVLVLAGVQDAGNVGAIVRVAEACGATGVICCDGTADPFGWKALRGAMGSTFRLPIAVKQPFADVVAQVRAAGLRLFATVPRDGVSLTSCNLRVPAAIVLGAEGSGLPMDAAASADERLTIPMRAPVESLNVATAAALILYEAERQRALRQGRSPALHGRSD
jgi:TrmH family RNA methyltransferase